MARDRFSDLDRIVEALREARADINTLPQNLDFTKYWKWKRGETTRRAIVRPNTQGEVEVGVIAFGLDKTNAKAKIKVKMTGRAKAQFTSVPSNTLFGLELNTLTDYSANSSFTPAKITLAKKVANSTEERSDITGRKYRKKTDDSYTIPIGQTNAKDRYQEVLESITGTPAITNVYLVSGKNEQFRRD